MPYDRLQDRLADLAADDGSTPTVTALPDGSVDRHCRVLAGDEVLDTREAFARELAAGEAKSLALDVRRVEPGGQAVNHALQAAGLGADVALFGHLDHDVFRRLPVDGVSMGEPAVVHVLGFDDGAKMLVEGSRSIAAWSLADLTTAAASSGRWADAYGDLAPLRDVDAVCWANWASVTGSAAALRGVASAAMEWPADDATLLALDPGDVVAESPARLRTLRAVLAELAGVDGLRVVLNANPNEIAAIAATLPGQAADVDVDEQVRALRADLDCEAVVSHGRDRAIGGTRDDHVAVETIPVADPERYTGGGDRFGGALAVALAAGWDWATTLACGNAAATYYITHEATGAPAELAAFVDGRT